MLHRFGCTLSALSATLIALSPAFAAPQPATGVGVSVNLRHKQNYLILRDPLAETPTFYYARRAHFTYSADGHFVTREGMYLQGYAPSEGLYRQGAIGDIQGPSLAEMEAPQPTTDVTLAGNLEARYDCRTFDPTFPEDDASSLASRSVVVYDERGSSHAITFYFSPCASATVGPNHYDLSYDVNAMAGRQWLGRAHLFFDGQGRLAQVNDDNTAAIVLESGLGSKQVITLNLGDAVNMPGNSGRRGLTCYSHGPDGPHMQFFADGRPAGLLTSVDTVDDFTLVGHTTAGATRSLGTLVTATFSPATRLGSVAPGIYQRRDRGGDDLTHILQAKYRGKASTHLTVAGNLPFGFEETSLDPLHPENSRTTFATTQIFSEDAAWDLTLYFAREIRTTHARGYPIRYQYTAAIAPTDGHQPSQLVGNGTLYFDRGGRLAQINGDDKAQLDLTHIQGWSTPVSLRFDHMTVYDAPAYLRLQADGVANGLLTALRIHADGEVEGTFTNFLVKAVGALEVSQATGDNSPTQQEAKEPNEQGRIGTTSNEPNEQSARH